MPQKKNSGKVLGFEPNPKPTDMGKYAVWYARHGMPVFPVWDVQTHGMQMRCGCGDKNCPSPGKHPIGNLAPKGCLNATKDIPTIKAWWKDKPNANIGMRTGCPDPANPGWLVIDIDSYKPDAELNWDELIGEEPDTIESITGGGGRQLFLALDPRIAPDDTHTAVHNAQDITPGVDLRGQNGYVVLPPSTHITGTPYRWSIGKEPGANPPAKANRQLLDKLKATPEKPKPKRKLTVMGDIAQAIKDTHGRHDAVRNLIMNIGKGNFGEEELTFLALASLAATGKSGKDAAREAKGIADWCMKQLAEKPKPTPQPKPTEEEQLPPLPKECWRKGFQDYKEVFTASEAPQEHRFGVLLTAAGSILGRSATIDYGTPLYPNFYTCLVGATGSSRKSSSQMGCGMLLDQTDQGIRRAVGVGSAEGLIELLSPDKEHDDPVRALLDIDELAQLFQKSRNKATIMLLPKLTELYNCPSRVDLPNRKAVAAPLPFLAIIASTTLEWLHEFMTLSDVMGGFTGRWSWICGPAPTKAVPIPLMDAQKLSGVEQMLIDLRDRHGSQRQYRLAGAARRVFEGWYEELYAWTPKGPILKALKGRLHTQALKVALVHAAIEGTPEITVGQLLSGCAFANWQKLLQKGLLEGFGAEPTAGLEERILSLLHRWWTQTKTVWVKPRLVQQNIRKVGTKTVTSEMFKRAIRSMTGLTLVERVEDATIASVDVLKEGGLDV